MWLGRQRDCKRRGKRIDGMIAADAREIEGFGGARRVLATDGRPKNRDAVCVAEQREDEIAPRIHVVHGDEQLAEARLTEILRARARRSAGRARARRRRQRRCPANQIPQLRSSTVDRERRPRAARR